MAKQITICGHELTLKYSMHAATAFEKMTGKNALDLSQFQTNQIAPLAELGYCMLLAANDLEKLGIDLEKVLADLDTYEKMMSFVQSITEELTAFFQPNKADKPEKQEDAAKNA